MGAGRGEHEQPHTSLLLGGIVANGQFYIEAYVGGQRFTMQVDTGSTVIALPAKQCSDCKDYVYYPLVPEHPRRGASGQPPLSNSTMIDHRDSVCCHSDYCESKALTGGCGFSLAYGDGSGADGVLVRDNLTVANYTSELIFGAILVEHGDFESSKSIDGILGMAPAGLACTPSCVDSLIGQLHTKGLVTDQFSMCLGPRGGALTLGEVDQDLMAKREAPMLGGAADRMQYVPLLRGSFYTVMATQFMFDGVEQATHKKMILDSGTTLLLLESKLYNLFVADVVRKCPHEGLLLARFKGGHCIELTTLTRTCFPTISFVLSPTLTIAVSPEQYLIPNVNQGNAHSPLFYCLGIGISSFGHSLLGDVIMQEYLIDFNHGAKRIGFGPRDVDQCGGSSRCEQEHSTCGSCAQDAACYWCPHTATCANSSQVTTCVTACKGTKGCLCSNEVLWTLWPTDVGLLCGTVVLVMGQVAMVMYNHGAQLIRNGKPAFDGIREE